MSTKITTPTFLSFVVPGGVDTVHRSFETGWTADVGRYTATSITISHPMEPVTTRDLSRSAVRRTIAEHLPPLLLAANPEIAKDPAAAVWAKGEGHRGRKPAKKQWTEPDEVHLGRTALVFRLATTVGGFPVRAVERSLGIDYATAKSWVAKARRRGLMS